MPLGTPIASGGGADSIPSQPRINDRDGPGGTALGAAPFSPGSLGGPRYRPSAEWQSAYYTTDPLIGSLRAQLAALGQQSALGQAALTNRIGSANALYGLGVGQLEQQYGFDARLLANQRFRDVDLAREALAGRQASATSNYGAYLADLARQLGLAGDAYGLARQSAASDLELAGRAQDDYYDRYAREWDLLGDQFRQGRVYTNQRRGFAGDEFGLSRESNLSAFRQASRGAQSQATTTGGMLSAGFRDTRRELGDQLNQADERAQQRYDQQIAALSKEDQDLELALRGGQSDLTYGLDTTKTQYARAAAGAQQAIDRAGLTYRSVAGDIDYRRGQAGRDYADTQRDIDQRRKMIDSLASDFGVRSEQLSATLENGIQRLGIDLNDTLSQLADMHASRDANRRAQATAVTQQILQAAMQSSAPPVAPTPMAPMSPVSAGSPPASDVTIAGIPIVDAPGVRTVSSRSSTGPLTGPHVFRATGRRLRDYLGEVR